MQIFQAKLQRAQMRSLTAYSRNTYAIPTGTMTGLQEFVDTLREQRDEALGEDPDEGEQDEQDGRSLWFHILKVTAFRCIPYLGSSNLWRRLEKGLV